MSAQITPVEGVLLLDTGAYSTCIARHAAEALGLLPLRLATCYGSVGQHENPVYLAQLTIPMREGKLFTHYVLDLEAQGIPEMEKMIAEGQVTCDGKPVRLIGLLGRDFLEHCRFKYDGPEGQLFLEVDPAKIHAIQKEETPATQP